MERVVSQVPKRRYYTSQQKQYFLSEFSKSGMSSREFCKLHGLGESGFGKWQTKSRRLLAGVQGQQRSKPEKGAGFARLHIKSPVVKSSGQVGLFAEVGGIRIYQPVAASYLKELLQ